jgi:hypothetical protein
MWTAILLPVSASAAIICLPLGSVFLDIIKKSINTMVYECCCDGTALVAMAA